MPDLIFRPALVEEAAQVAKMVNQSYRGETSRMGWTTEAHLLDGLRTGEPEVRQLITAADSIILLCLKGDELLGSVLLEHADDEAHIGMFVVRPLLQNQGIGKQLLAAAETKAREHWGVSKTSMFVISMRQELIAFYERRGYRRTGMLREFPVNPAVWQPKVEGLVLEKLEKSLL